MATEWRCSECGCTLDEAQAKRRRRGEPLIWMIRTVVCSEKCRRKRESKQTIAWQKRNWANYLASRRERRRRKTATVARRRS